MYVHSYTIVLPWINDQTMGLPCKYRPRKSLTGIIDPTLRAQPTIFFFQVLFLHVKSLQYYVDW